MNIDGTLIQSRDELVVAAGRWHATTRRRRRRLVLSAGALAAVLVVSGAAVAASGWLIGSPAPPTVKSDFGSYAPQLGFNPQPGKAVLVASEDPYQLFATTNRQGTYCVLVSAPWKRPGPHGEGGDCVPAATTAKSLWAGLGGVASGSNGEIRLVIDGRTTDPDAASVRFPAPDGRPVTVPIGSSGFFVGGVAGRFDLCKGWDPSVALLDAAGKQIDEVRFSSQLFGRCVQFRGGRVIVRP